MRGFHGLFAIAALMAGGSSIAAAASATPRRFGKIYGAENIKRHLQQQKLDHSRRAGGSIATGNRRGGAHLHQREINRRRRQLVARNLAFLDDVTRAAA